MKNLLNYLDDYFDDNIEETLCNRKFKDKISISKEQKEIDLGATLIKSKNMLKNFTPEREV